MRKRFGVVFSILCLVALSHTATAGGSCTPIDQPDTDYLGATTACSLGPPGSSTSVCTFGGATVAMFSVPLSVRAIGMGWATWSSPPDSELGSQTIVGFTGGADSLTITLVNPVAIAGVEVEPNRFDLFQTTASFRDADGNELVSVTRLISGQAGARLMAADCSALGDPAIASVVITMAGGPQGFAIAQLRGDALVNCNCFDFTDCRSGAPCDVGRCRETSAPRYIGLCRTMAGALAKESVEAVATSMDLYFQAYLKAIQKGGGSPDASLIQKAQAVPLSEKARAQLQTVIRNALDAVIGLDFVLAPSPQYNESYSGGIHAVPGVEEGFAIVEATRQGFVEGIRTGNPTAIVESLVDFWRAHPGYEPKRSGRCYRQGHARIKGPEDSLTCQIEMLTQVLERMIASAN